MTTLSPSTQAHAPAHAALLATMLVWGTLIPTVGVLLSYIDAYGMSAVRYGLGAAALAATLFVRVGAGWLAGLPWVRILALGSFGMAGFTTLYTVGIAYADPVSAAIVASLGPIVSVVFCWAMWRMPFAAGTGIALTLGAIGSAAAVLGHADFKAFDGRHGGEILIVASQICWAWYSVQTQKWLGHLDQTRMTAVTMAAGAFALIVIYALAIALGAARLPSALPDLPTALLLLWTAFAITVFGVLSWNFATSRVGIVVAAIYLNLIPVVAILITVALGNHATPLQLLGGALVLIGVIQLQLRRLAAQR
jgi:drug/metabolite transporter (DMT)-like permease